MTDYAVGVVGAGTMGTGIAITAARAGFATVLTDASAPQLERAVASARAFLDKSVRRGKLTEAGRDEVLGRLTTAPTLDGLAGCGAVVEAIAEDVQAKRDLFGAVAKVCADDVLLVTNTSTLSVTMIAAGAPRPERVVGLHFCNPAPLMPLVEVVDGMRTSAETHAEALRLTADLGKTAVEVKDTPGFIVNRLLIPWENDCIRALERGVATVEDIDRAVRFGLGYPMGPFTLLDTVGLDLHRAVSLSLYHQLRDPRFAPPPLVDRMIAAGRLGRKSGRGFYEYEAAGLFGT